MQRNKKLSNASILLVLLGIIMIYLGTLGGEKLTIPPIITGIGFFIIAWIFRSSKK